MPAGGHLQGIQVLNDSAVIITASSGSYSYYVTGLLHPASKSGSINKLQKIADMPFKHAGGCQLSEGKLMVGVEDNAGKNKSEIVAISFNDSLQQLSNRVIGHRQGIFKRSTAGAVGFTNTRPGEYMVAVGDWDSRNIDLYFYRSTTGGFDSISTFHVPDNQKWCSYQSINLLKEASGSIYLIGLGLDGSNNRADLFKVEISRAGANLILVSSRTFKCQGGASFRYGAGIGIANNQKLVIYSCGMHLGKKVALNIFTTYL